MKPGKRDDGRCCRQSGGSGGDDEKASGDGQKIGVLGTADGGVDGKDESAGHQFQGISVCSTCNRHISSRSALPIVVPLHFAQQTQSAAKDHRGDDHREAATGMDIDLVASTQEPPTSITSGAAGHRRRDDTSQSIDLQHQSPASEGEPLDYEEGEQLSPIGAEEGPPQEG